MYQRTVTITTTHEASTSTLAVFITVTLKIDRCAPPVALLLAHLLPTACFNASDNHLASKMTDLNIVRPAVVSAVDSRQSEKTVTCSSSATQAPLTMAKDEVSQTVVPHIEKLFERDGYLRQHEYEIRRRYREFSNLLSGIEKAEGNYCPLLMSLAPNCFRI